MFWAYQLLPLRHKLDKLYTAIGNSGYPPPPLDGHIKYLLGSAQNSICELDEAIERLTTSLKEERKSRLIYIDHLRSSIAPHRRLPAEILAQIFCWCNGSSFLEIALPHNRRGKFPWNLTHVCSFWRRVALGEPTVWNKLEISYHPLPPKQRQKFNDMIECILLRSDPIEIRLDIDAFWDDFPTSLILKHAHRIRVLFLQLPVKPLWRLLSTPTVPFPILEILVITCNDGGKNTPLTIDSQALLFAETPALTSFQFETGSREPPSICFPVDISLPCFQFTCLDFQHLKIGIEHAYFIFTMCSMLISCNVQIKPEDNLPDPPESIILPCLQDFLLTCDYCDASSSRFFQPLMFPALQTFLMEGPRKTLSGQTLSTLAPALLDFFRRSECPLVDFQVEDTRVSRNSVNVGPFLRELPSLTFLYLPCGGLRRPSMKSIALGDLGRDLETIVCCIDYADIPAFLHMLAARWVVRSSLGSLLAPGLKSMAITVNVPRLVRCRDVKNELKNIATGLECMVKQLRKDSGLPGGVNVSVEAIQHII
jgi:hypothetical protein